MLHGAPISLDSKWRVDHCSLHTYRQLERRLSTRGFEVAFADVKIVTAFYREKVRRYLGCTGLLLLAIVNPDRLPLPCGQTSTCGRANGRHIDKSRSRSEGVHSPLT